MFWFNSKKKLPDISVWMNAERKYIAIAQAVFEAHARSVPVIIITHFPESLRLMRMALAACELDSVTADSSGLSVAWDPRQRPLLLLSATLPTPQGLGAAGVTGEALAIITEVYPLEDRDRAAVEFLEALPFPVRIERQASLDEELFRLFGGERLVALLKNLGGEADEVIRHGMITSSVEKAQKKIAKKARGDSSADSALEWMDKNYPEPV